MPMHRLCVMTFALTALLFQSMLISGCSRNKDAEAQPPLSSSQPPADANPSPQQTVLASSAGKIIDPADRSQYRYLYVVYCNGSVDKLDLTQQSKIGSFQLSERSGSQRAIAAPPRTGMQPEVCLARPVVTGDSQDHKAGVTHIVASDQWAPTPNGQAHFRLLTYALPAWNLQHTQDIGSFDVLNHAPPRIVRTTGGSLIVQPHTQRNPDGSFASPQSTGNDPSSELGIQAKTYTGAEAWERAIAFEWSAGQVLLGYTLLDQRGSGIAIANQAHKQIVEIAKARKGYPPPTSSLAPGGNFVLLATQRNVHLGKDLMKIEATGELKLYAANGTQVGMFMIPSIAGNAETMKRAGKTNLNELRSNLKNWCHIALTPDGLAIFTDRRGNYIFVALGRTFGTEPVANTATDDLEGTRPGLVYAAE